MFDWNDEIKNGPLAEALAPYVAAIDDVTVAALLNAKTIDAVRSVSRLQFIQWSTKTGMRAKIQDISVTAEHPLRSTALAMIDITQGGGTEGINFTNPDNIAVLDAWVSAGLLSTQGRDELLALATIKISRAEQVAGRDATIFDIATALRNSDGSPRT